MKATIARTRTTADGTESAQLELELDGWLETHPEVLRVRVERLRGLLEQLLADGTPPAAPEPKPGPGPANHAPAIATPPPAGGPTYGPVDPGPPSTGKALYTWARRRDERGRTTETFAFLRALAKSWGLGPRIIQWSDEDAAAAYHEAAAKLDAQPMAKGA